MIEFLDTGPADASWTLMLAHGAGAGMDSPMLEQMTQAISAQGIRVLRFEFGYMAARRTSGKRRPPPKAEKLADEYRAAVAAARERGIAGRLAIGGKSMGGRVASFVAEEFWRDGKAGALVCLGYPFHPPGMPEQTRTAHLQDLACPTLIVQGIRDPFGNREEVAEYLLAQAIAVTWIADGDHDFGPRGASGFTRKGNMATAAQAVGQFLSSID
jgi:predicted alpha/beta-hydrolase family hydrolase